VHLEVPVGRDALAVGLEGDDPCRAAAVRVREHDEAEVGREALGDGLPGITAVGARIHAVVVLGEQVVGVDGVTRHLVHALAELRIGIRHEVGADALVAGLPGGPAVVGPVDPARAHRHMECVVGRARQDGVGGRAAEARPPFAAMRVVPQATVQRERLPMVRGFPDGDGLAAGPDDARAALRVRLDLPHPLKGGAVVGPEPDPALLGLSPGLAEVVRMGDAGAEVPRHPACEQTGAPAPGVDRHAGDLLHEERRSGKRPLLPVRARREPQTLLGADGEERCSWC